MARLVSVYIDYNLKTIRLCVLPLTSIRISTNVRIRTIDRIAVAGEAFEFDSFLRNGKKFQTAIWFKTKISSPLLVLNFVFHMHSTFFHFGRPMENRDDSGPKI